MIRHESLLLLWIKRRWKNEEDVKKGGGEENAERTKSGGEKENEEALEPEADAEHNAIERSGFL